MNEKPEVLIMKYQKFLYLKEDFELYNSTGKKVILIFLNSHNYYLEIPVKSISKVIINDSIMTIFAFNNEMQVSFEMKDRFKNDKPKISEFWSEKNERNTK